MVRINSAGEMVRDDDPGVSSPARSSSSSSSSPPSSQNPSFLSSFQSRRIDVFGFNLEPRQLFVTVCAVFLMAGTGGAVIFLVALGAYNLYGYANPPGRNRNSRNRGSSSGSGASGRGEGGGGGRRGGGPCIKGVKDLPCDPKGG